VLDEDHSVNRLQDALETWKSVANNEYLTKVPAILFLNKKDLLKEKAAKVDLKVCFADYSGGLDYKEMSKFIQQKFMGVVSSTRQAKVYPYITQATDTSNIQLVWQTIKDVLVGAAVDDILV